MRRGAAGLAASLGLALALSCSPVAMAAKQSPRPREVPARVAGAITVAWHGDPARGCAAAGVCDVSGSLVYTPQDVLATGINIPHHGLRPTEVILPDSTAPTTIRVQRSPPGGEPSMCVDSAPVPFMLLEATPVDANHSRFDFSDAVLVGSSSLSSGRCAGPVASDLRGKLPSGVLDLRPLKRGSSLLNLSSRKPFASGPFSGEVISTLGIRFGARSGTELEDVFSLFSFGDFGGSKKPRRHVRVLELSMQYHLNGVTGALVTRFAGLDQPLCDRLDACGASGTITYAPGTVSGDAFIVAERRLRPGEHPTLRSALRELRTGRLGARADLELRPDTFAHVSATVSHPGDATCTDSMSPAFAPIDLQELGHALQVRLAQPEDFAPDGLRTHCAGPSQGDTLARGSMAAGRIALARLGARSLKVQVSRPGTFSAGAYAGTRSGALSLQLARRRIRERVVLRSVR